MNSQYEPIPESFNLPVRWYVISDRVSSVVYVDVNHEFRFLNRLTNDDARLTEQELDSDKPGRGFSSAGGGTIHHSLDRTFKHHEKVAADFSRVIARHLELGLSEGSYQELVLVSEPHFLGLIKSHLTPRVEKTVMAEIGKEYTQVPPKQIRDFVLTAMRMKQEAGMIDINESPQKRQASSQEPSSRSL